MVAMILAALALGGVALQIVSPEQFEYENAQGVPFARKPSPARSTPRLRPPRIQRPRSMPSGEASARPTPSTFERAEPFRAVRQSACPQHGAAMVHRAPPDSRHSAPSIPSPSVRDMSATSSSRPIFRLTSSKNGSGFSRSSPRDRPLMLLAAAERLLHHRLCDSPAGTARTRLSRGCATATTTP